MKILQPVDVTPDALGHFYRTTQLPPSISLQVPQQLLAIVIDALFLYS
jgi:hypothetical protein